MLGVRDVGEAGVRVGDGLEMCEEAAWTVVVVGLEDAVGCFVAIERTADTVDVGDVEAVGDVGCGERVLNCEDWAETVVVTEGVVVG